MKTFLKILVISVIIIIISVVSFFYIDDESLSPYLKPHIADYTVPEEIDDNAFIMLAGIERAENILLPEFKNRVKQARTKTPYTLSISNILEENETKKFKELSWLFNCWITHSPPKGACIQPQAFKSKSLTKNSLFLDRYEEALSKETFEAGGMISFDNSIVDIATLYMASVGYYYHQGDVDEALRRWKLNHDSITHFLISGAHTLETREKLRKIYSMSLQVAERLLAYGLNSEHWDTIITSLSTDVSASINKEQAFKRDLSSIYKQTNEFFRPTGFDLLSLRAFYWLLPSYLNTYLNSLTGKLIEYDYISKQDIAIGDSVAPKTPITHHMKNLFNDIENYFLLYKGFKESMLLTEAHRRALLLGILLRKEDVIFEQLESWVKKQTLLYNPITQTPYKYSYIDNCFLLEHNNQNFCILIPSFIPQTPIPNDGFVN